MEAALAKHEQRTREPKSGYEPAIQLIMTKREPAAQGLRARHAQPMREEGDGSCSNTGQTQQSGAELEILQANNIRSR